MRYILFIYIIWGQSFFVFSQTTITGKISDSTNTGISSVNVLLKNQETFIVAYTYSDKNGEYLLTTDEIGAFNLSFSTLSHETKVIPIKIVNNDNKITRDILLKEMSLELDEIIIQAEKSITRKKDTIVFKAKAFAQGNEHVIEDLLKKIPGVIVESNGTIKIGNQEVERVMVDGDDFFEQGYKILTKNMPPNQIDKIELLQKYSKNRLLKGVEQSDRVAINLKLKDGAKRQWFGNFDVGYDITPENRYKIQNNLMNFGKKNKYYFLSSFNNMGYDITGDINRLIRPSDNNESPSSIGDTQNTKELLDSNISIPNFDPSRTNFNNARLISLNTILKLSKKTKMKTLALFNWDKNLFFRNINQTFNINNSAFINTEDYTLQKKKFNGFGKIDLIYNISKNKMLEIFTKYNRGNTKNQSNLIFNDKQTNEKLKSRNELFDQKVTFTNKVNKNNVFLLTGRYIHEKSPQNYNINRFFFEELFPVNNTINNTQQLSKHQVQFIGLEAHLINKKENGNVLEFQLGNQFKEDKLLSTLFLKETDSIIDTPEGYQNKSTYLFNDSYIKSNYRLLLSHFTLSGELGFHQLFNKIKSDNTVQQPFYINPKIGLEWEINTKNKILTQYSNNTTNAGVSNIYNDFILTDFRSFSKGTGTFNQLNASTLFLNYELGNWSDKFFSNTYIQYVKNHDFLSTNSVITSNYNQSEKIIIKNREMLYISSNINRYFKSISSNVKFNLSFSKSNYKNIVNNSNLREIKSYNYNYGFELRSAFQGVFNYHIGTKWMTNEIKNISNNSFTNNVTFLDISLIFNNNLITEIQAERYFFGNLDDQSSTYYFLDIETKYRLKKNKLTFSLSGKNLLNTKKFITYSFNDISTSKTEYNLLPRYLFLKLEYRF
ncbi:carboxypeptidase-like regulatory domain-containing protein [Aquimarina algiphila]|uniref:carboxypeptidase-like regulatory domain-containing protein n=1 Tax=Aquimarina algiphila TaxID=2047982 RepID=UPI002491D6CD|nr:carboxypeptidase-like regulatory domain-containing protein [Aquimarina algiphila]